MECNKEEAIRVKGIAEIKMRSTEFIGAKKILIKAQQLFPDLENISQMLTVCEVHCAAAIEVNKEMDWYGILQVEPTAEDMIIKKQYRRLALLLHPDKNKFAGAETAFKLIGEAYRILSDKAKRALHDMKRGAQLRNILLRQPAQQSSRTADIRKQPGSNNTAKNPSTQFNGSNQQKVSPFSSAQTFWTICTFCGTRYQYYQSILKKSVRCQHCMMVFIAHELDMQAVPSGTNSGCHSGIPQQGFRGPGAHMVGKKSYFGNAASQTVFQENAGGGSTSSQPWSSTVPSTGGYKMDNEVRAGNGENIEKVKLQQEVSKRGQESSVGNAKQKRSRKKFEESSHSDSSGSSVIFEENGYPERQNPRTNGNGPRRSTRKKQNVSYYEGRIDDDNFNFPSVKRSKRGETSSDGSQSGKASSVGHSGGVEESANGVDDELNKQKSVLSEKEGGLQRRARVTISQGECTGNATGLKATSSDPNSLSYPDPEFFDFGVERDASKFAVDQIWAVYDNLDAMPRFYVLIRNVYITEFKLRFTWLEPDPIAKAEMEWSEEDLPVACGNFKLGRSQSTKDQLMFSHLVYWEKGKKRTSYRIYPRKGEVWAIFKDWNIGWSSNSDKHKAYEYEVVEVLSDYVDDTEIHAVHLIKVNGFVSLFVRAVGKDTVALQIPPSDMLRFSHKVPSYRMTGGERHGIPPGSFELDTASLPSNFSETFPSISLESMNAGVENLEKVSGGLCSRSSDEEKLATSTTKMSCFQLNGQKSMNPSPTRENTDCVKVKEHIQVSSNQHSASNAVKHVENDRTPASQVNPEEGSHGAQERSIYNTDEFNEPRTSSPSLIYEYPDSEFHNFEEARSTDKYESGQIWALYSEEDGYPKYYGEISKVEHGDFEVHVTWLEACPVRKEEKQWLKRLPIACGAFMITSETITFDTTGTFSHLVQAVPRGRKGHYDIYPNSGEVWALYRNWNIKWSVSDAENSEYDVVEIISGSGSGIEVMLLTKVDGYRAVFMPERKGLAISKLQIAQDEYLRFSHKIPAFRLTEERGGKLRGYWELDPASVPQILLVCED